MQLWRLKNLKSCSQQTGDPGELMIYSFSPSSKASNLGKPIVWFSMKANRLETQGELIFILCLKVGKKMMSQLKGTQADRESSF